MFDNLAMWAERPFNPEMDWAGWVFLIVFILIICGAWFSVLHLFKSSI